MKDITNYKNALNFFLLITVMSISTLTEAATVCYTRDALKSHAGHYAKKVFWENLPKTKIWSKAKKKFNTYYISAIDISTNGEISFIDGWHEAMTGSCVRFEGKELWAKNPYGSSPKWVAHLFTLALLNLIASYISIESLGMTAISAT